MAFSILRKLPTLEEIKTQIPLPPEVYQQINTHRQEIKNILTGHDKRLLLIVGPCSAWPINAVLEYAKALKEIESNLKHKFKIVMRVYIQKPRTVKGWTGPINQPDPLAPPNVVEGIYYCRRLMVEVAKLGLAIADECLFTANYKMFEELLSWVAIGARSSEDQERRIFASSLELPVGMKNPTHGPMQIGVNAIVVAQESHVCAFDGYELKTSGNPYAHLVLRGSNNKPNYYNDYLQEALELMVKDQVQNPAVIIDASHDNSIINGKKDPTAQSQVMLEVLNSIKLYPQLKSLIKGFMLESFLKSGNQNIDLDSPIDMEGLSITDPCLSLNMTKELLLKAAELLN